MKTDILAINLPHALEGDSARKTCYRLLVLQDNTSIALNGQALGTSKRGFEREIARSSERAVNHFAVDSPIFVVQYMNSICDEFPGHASCGDQGAEVELSYFGALSMTNLPAVGQFHSACSLYHGVGGPQSGAR
jgi:hypothetical protein